jgi:hypothetical protein
MLSLGAPTFKKKLLERIFNLVNNWSSKERCHCIFLCANNACQCGVSNLQTLAPQAGILPRELCCLPLLSLNKCLISNKQLWHYKRQKCTVRLFLQGLGLIIIGSQYVYNIYLRLPLAVCQSLIKHNYSKKIYGLILWCSLMEVWPWTFVKEKVELAFSSITWFFWFCLFSLINST